MPNFPSWSLTVSAGLRASVVARQLVTNYNLMESSLRQAMGAMPSIEAHRKALQTDSGSVASGAYSHFYLGGITASQHHDKNHGTTHITATDPVPLASAGRNGLISSTLQAGLGTIKAWSDKPVAVGRYVGNYISGTSVSQLINLGFRPVLLKVQHKSTAHGMWETYGGQAFPYEVWYHSVSTRGTYEGNNIKHSYLSAGAVKTIRITNKNQSTQGFRVYSTLCNKNAVTYYFLAVGG